MFHHLKTGYLHYFILEPTLKAFCITNTVYLAFLNCIDII